LFYPSKSYNELKMTKTKNRSSIRPRRANKRLVPAKSRLKVSQKKAVKNRIKRSRPVHKRILLSPAAILALLCATVFVAGWTYQVLADTMISSKIYAPALSTGAVITSPTAGTVFTTEAPVTVNGTCPGSSYVEIYVNGTFGGVGLCSAGHLFQVQVSLFNGANTLVAKDFNVTDLQGPATSGVSVSLDLPVSIPVAAASDQTITDVDNASNTANPVSLPPPLLLSSSFQWKTFSTGSTFSWKMDLEGGTPPYTVKIDWGDGQTSTYTFKGDPVFNISHSYAKPGYYSIKAYSLDAKGSQKAMQLAALISPPGKNGNFFGGGPTATPAADKLKGLPSFFVSSKNWLWIVWPSLLIVALMVFSFWLGELQDRRSLLARKKLSHPRSL